ncbi:hypothetical protein BHU72_04655 [Desulfuribacillus stibiiarsenatis]|uniref:DUF3153 domain-containing protein n=1 Tax=Desulfuribacillus stibiiarsenatis TaxID=1390249 RepID=A0A1E5L5Q0_9FIRM|nr:DUF3153 domain-containing protein [Desulfuribacillus stibiiarsenatis]OEH85384.1 hypothetical protein BHU72_04655 [Desulfuribacillus stibiiarsenatis]
MRHISIKGCLFVVLLSVLLVLTGCAEGTFHITIHKDYSADLRYQVGVNQGVAGFLVLAQENPMLELKRRAEIYGYSVTGYTDASSTGIIAERHVESIINFDAQEVDVLVAGLIDNSSGENKENFRFYEEKGFFTNRYQVEANIDLRNLNFLDNQEINFLGSKMLEQMNLQCIVTLPIKVIKHNAHETKDEGYTLVWNLKAGAENPIILQASVPNIKNIITFIIATILLVMGFFFIIKKT